MTSKTRYSINVTLKMILKKIQSMFTTKNYSPLNSNWLTNNDRYAIMHVCSTTITYQVAKEQFIKYSVYSFHFWLYICILLRVHEAYKHIWKPQVKNYTFLGPILLDTKICRFRMQISYTLKWKRVYRPRNPFCIFPASVLNQQTPRKANCN